MRSTYYPKELLAPGAPVKQNRAGKWRLRHIFVVLLRETIARTTVKENVQVQNKMGTAAFSTGTVLKGCLVGAEGAHTKQCHSGAKGRSELALTCLHRNIDKM